MGFADIISKINNAIWATPLIAVVFSGAVLYCFAIRFANISKIGLQVRLLISGGGSHEGLSDFETFC